MLEARKSDRVARDLLARIVAGDYPVGTILPREQELARAYGVNKSVVREAVKSLETHRILRPVKRRGTEVLDPAGSPSPDVLRAMLMPARGTVDRRILADLLEIRAQLDEHLTALAARRRTEDDLRALEACADRLERALSDPRAYSRAMDDFGAAMARASGNRVYRVLLRWHEEVHRDLHPILSVARPATPAHLRGVRFLLRCIAERDERTACSVVRAFHEWATPRILAVAELLEPSSPVFPSPSDRAPSP